MAAFVGTRISRFLFALFFFNTTLFMVGHLFQNYDTIYVRFFPRILAIIPATRYTCVFLSRILAFYSQVYDHFLTNEHIYSYFEKGCRKKVPVTIPKGNMGYDQYTVSDTVAVEPTFAASL